MIFVLHCNYKIMNTTYSMRVEEGLKKKFLEKSKSQGMDGSILLRHFMRSYVEQDDVVKIDIDEKVFDDMFRDPRVILWLEDLVSELHKKWY